MIKLILSYKAMLIKLASLLLFNLHLLLIYPSYASDKQPVVLSTIQPIHLIVKEILGDSGQAKLLIPAYRGIHNYRLQPSALRKIIKADLVVQVSPHFEAFLNGLLENKQTLILQFLEGIESLPMRHGHGHHEGHDVHEEHEEKVFAQDPHIWLYPENAIIIVKHLTAWLAEQYPHLAPAYNRNSQDLINKINQVYQEVKQDLAPLKANRYMVLHDATQYFQKHFQLLKPEILSFHENIQPGIKSYIKARKVLKAGGFSCVLVDKRKPNNSLQTIAGDLPIKFVVIDFSGAAAINYPELLRQFGYKMKACLTQHNP